MNGLIEEIKKKKELRGVDNSIIREIIDVYLRQGKIPQDTKARKLFVKEIRKRLRKYVGGYQIKYSLKKRKELIREGKFNDLLKAHSSTKERLPYYVRLKKLIDRMKINSILDLGCGLNPLALASKDFIYIATDINHEDLEIVSDFFDKKQINGKTKILNIRSDKFPRTDLTLALKVLDIVDGRNHEMSRKIIDKMNSKCFIVSFSTKTLSGREMRVPRREWFEKILQERNLGYKIKEFGNEVFYIIERH